MNDELDPREQALQAELDAGQVTTDNSDAHAYRVLYAGLSTSPAKLPSSFAYEAMVRAWRHRRPRDAGIQWPSLLISALVIATGLVSLYAVSSLGLAPKTDWHTLRSMLEALAPVRFVALGILLLTIADSIIGRFRHFRK